MKNKFYRRLAFVLSVSMPFFICTPIMAATGEFGGVEESIKENTIDVVVEKIYGKVR